MHEIFLGFLLMLAPLMDAQVRVIPLAALPDAEPCDVARRIAEQGACLEAADCGAFESWMRLFGEPRTEPLDPSLTERRERPRMFPCPAVPGTVELAPEKAPRPAPARTFPGR